MGIDDKYSDLKEAVRMHGAGWVQRHYLGERERALDRGNQDEADHWETRRQSVSVYVKRRRLIFNLFSLSAGALFALLPTGYAWLEEQDIGLQFSFSGSLRSYFTLQFALSIDWSAGREAYSYCPQLAPLGGKCIFGCEKLIGQDIV